MRSKYPDTKHFCGRHAGDAGDNRVCMRMQSGRLLKNEAHFPLHAVPV